MCHHIHRFFHHLFHRCGMLAAAAVVLTAASAADACPPAVMGCFAPQMSMQSFAVPEVIAQPPIIVQPQIVQVPTFFAQPVVAVQAVPVFAAAPVCARCGRGRVFQKTVIRQRF
jgi:hypothetical protein